MTKSGKHCGKRRNCSFWAISSVVTMFSKSRLLQRRQKVSIWGKGLSAFLQMPGYVSELFKNNFIWVINLYMYMQSWTSFRTYIRIHWSRNMFFYTEIYFINRRYANKNIQHHWPYRSKSWITSFNQIWQTFRNL